MELQTVSHVSKTFGISAQMLRYYERSGLIKSLRKNDYAYRIYDAENIKRLQQIVILRKLQIPVKQICVILNNPNAATATEIFKKNISEIQNEITALETIKSALEIFVAKIEELAAVRLNLNLLTDDSVMKLAESLSLIQKNIKENFTMNELNQANETISKTQQNLVRIVYRPTETVAKMWCEGCDPPDENAKNIMEKFIRDTDLFNTKPDFKVFSHGVGNESGSWFFVTIPENMEVAAPFKKAPFDGGLWAVVTVTRENNDGWAAIDKWNSDDFGGDISRPRHEVYFNPLNISKIKNTDLFNSVFNQHYLDIYVPIKEIKEITGEQIEKLNSAEKIFTQYKPVEVDLTTMINSGNFELQYENGLMKIINDRTGNGMKTSQQYKLPLKIELRVKCDGQTCIKFAKGLVLFNWHAGRTTLFTRNIENGDYVDYKNRGEIPADEFVDIEWILGREILAVKVNGELRHIENESGYIKALEENPALDLSSAITVSNGNDSFFGHIDSTMIIQSLRVTEIKPTEKEIAENEKAAEKLAEARKKAEEELTKARENMQPLEINLTSMEKQGYVKARYTNGSMEIQSPDGDNSGMETLQNFNAPLKIELRAKRTAQTSE